MNHRFGLFAARGKAAGSAVELFGPGGHPQGVENLLDGFRRRFHQFRGPVCIGSRKIEVFAVRKGEGDLGRLLDDPGKEILALEKGQVGANSVGRVLDGAVLDHGQAVPEGPGVDLVKECKRALFS